jgi:hypothetical protein
MDQRSGSSSSASVLHTIRIKEMAGLYGLSISVIIGSAYKKDQRDGCFIWTITISVIIIGIGSARNEVQRDGWFIWTNDRCHHHRHRFCTHVTRIKEMTGLLTFSHIHSYTTTPTSAPSFSCHQMFYTQNIDNLVTSLRM